MNRQKMSFWGILNMCFGFLGIQMGLALQNANVSNEEYQKLVNDANQLYALAKQFGIVK